MKKQYEALNWEVIKFTNADMIMANTGCEGDCPDDCSHCFYLVCEPQDVIIG